MCIVVKSLYSGLNLNQGKATKPQTVQIVRQGEATPYWFKVNPLYIDGARKADYIMKTVGFSPTVLFCLSQAGKHVCHHCRPLVHQLLTLPNYRLFAHLARA